MFFMGGMTLGYLHPPVRAKREDGAIASSDKDGPAVQRQPMSTPFNDSAVERTLLWVRRILR